MAPDVDGTRSVCRLGQPDLWYPAPGQSAAPAKEICSGCAVRAQCLDWALEREESGIWGGLSSEERKQLLRGAHNPTSRVAVVEGRCKTCYEYLRVYGRERRSDLAHAEHRARRNGGTSNT